MSKIKADMLILGASIPDADEKLGSVAIVGDKIAAVASEYEIRAKYESETEIKAYGKYLFPGMVSTHTHLFQMLLKGLCADYPLEEWVNRMITPVVSILKPEDLYWAAKLGTMEAIRSGTTTTLDFNYVTYNPEFSDAVIQALRESGIRAVYGRGIHSGGEDVGVSRDLIEKPEVFIKDVERIAGKYHGDDMMTVWMAPSVPWGMNMDGLKAIRAYSQSSGVPVTMHVMETDSDEKYTMKHWGKRPLQLLDSLGYLDSRFILVHGVKAKEEDLRLMEQKHVGWSHCMAANLYLGSGIAPVTEVSDEVPVSLGVDGAASNNSQDMIELLKLTTLAHKGFHRDASVITAKKVVGYATQGGARALGMEKKIGSIAAGKKADMFIFDPDDAKATPVCNPYAAIVYSSSIKNVSTVIVNGKILMRDRKFTCADEAQAVEQVKSRSLRIRKELGL